MQNITSFVGQQVSRQECFVGTLKSHSSAKWVTHTHEIHEHVVQHISLTHSGQMLRPRALKERILSFNTILSVELYCVKYHSLH